MQDMCVLFLGWEDPLEKDMTTDSSILAWRVPWTEKPDRLQSMGLQESDMTQRLNSQVKKKYVQGCHHDGLKGFYVNEKNKEKVATFENQMQFFQMSFFFAIKALLKYN